MKKIRPWQNRVQLVRRVAAFILGACFGVALFELALFSIGSYARRSLASHPDPSSKILCVGNSYTAGLGAPPGYSYCDQLNSLLRKEPAFVGFSVVNIAQPGMNTAQILEALPAALEKYKPRLVIAMPGEPNYWNQIGMRPEFASKAGPARQLGRLLFSGLSRLRIYRFFTLYGGGWEKSVAKIGESDLTAGYEWLGRLYGFGQNQQYRDIAEADVPRIQRGLSAIISRGDSGFTAALVLARLYYYRLRDPAQAARWYEYSISRKPDLFRIDAWNDLLGIKAADPDAFRRYFALIYRHLKTQLPPGDFLRLALKASTCNGLMSVFPKIPPEKDKIEREVSIFKRLVELRPASVCLRLGLQSRYRALGRTEESYKVALPMLRENPITVPPYFTGQLLWLLRNAPRPAGVSPELVQEFGRARAQFQQLFPERAELAEDPSLIQIDQWVRADILHMKDLSEAAGAKFLLQTYPPLRNRKVTRSADEVIRSVARTNQIPLSDTGRYLESDFFQQKGREVIYSLEHGENDSHLNAYGYHLVAEFLILSIKQLRLLP